MMMEDAESFASSASLAVAAALEEEAAEAPFLDETPEDLLELPHAPDPTDDAANFGECHPEKYKKEERYKDLLEDIVDEDEDDDEDEQEQEEEEEAMRRHELVGGDDSGGPASVVVAANDVAAGSLIQSPRPTAPMIVRAGGAPGVAAPSARSPPCGAPSSETASLPAAAAAAPPSAASFWVTEGIPVPSQVGAPIAPLPATVMRPGAVVSTATTIPAAPIRPTQTGQVDVITTATSSSYSSMVGMPPRAEEDNSTDLLMSTSYLAPVQPFIRKKRPGGRPGSTPTPTTVAAQPNPRSISFDPIQTVYKSRVNFSSKTWYIPVEAASSIRKNWKTQTRDWWSLPQDDDVRANSANEIGALEEWTKTMLTKPMKRKEPESCASYMDAMEARRKRMGAVFLSSSAVRNNSSTSTNNTGANRGGAAAGGGAGGGRGAVAVGKTTPEPPIISTVVTLLFGNAFGKEGAVPWALASAVNQPSVSFPSLLRWAVPWWNGRSKDKADKSLWTAAGGRAKSTNLDSAGQELKANCVSLKRRFLRAFRLKKLPVATTATTNDGATPSSSSWQHRYWSHHAPTEPSLKCTYLGSSDDEGNDEGRSKKPPQEKGASSPSTTTTVPPASPTMIKWDGVLTVIRLPASLMNPSPVPSSATTSVTATATTATTGKQEPYEDDDAPLPLSQKQVDAMNGGGSTNASGGAAGGASPLVLDDNGWVVAPGPSGAFKPLVIPSKRLTTPPSTQASS